VNKIMQRYRYSAILLRELVITDFKLRYQGSVLGYLWSLLRPLFMFVVLYLVFTVFLPTAKDIPHKPVYLFLGIVLWNFFNEITTGSVGSILGKGDLLRKINFPKYVIASGLLWNPYPLLAQRDSRPAPQGGRAAYIEPRRSDYPRCSICVGY
jgi:ABC-2 type transport system permease protein